MLPDINTIHKHLDENTRLFLDILDTIPPDKLNRTNPNVQWSILSCAEHLLIREEEIHTQALHGPTKPVADREPDSKINAIRECFEDLDKRLAVPAPTIPDHSYEDIASFSKAFRANREAIKTALKDHLTEECLEVEHTWLGLGLFTKIEWAYYLIFHAEKHLQQITKIEATLDGEHR